MAIAFDTASSGDSGSGQTTLTISHTCNGSNRLLVFGLAMPASAPNINSVKYAGVDMNLISSVIGMPNETGAKIAFYYLLNPAAGTNNIVVTISTGYRIIGAGASYTGVNQSTGFDTGTTGSEENIVNSYSNSLTTAENNELLIWFVATQNNASVLTGTSGATKRVDQGMASNSRSCHILDKAAATSGSNTINATNSQNARSANIIASFKQAVSGPVSIKSRNGLAAASIESINGLAYGSIKSINGLS